MQPVNSSLSEAAQGKSGERLLGNEVSGGSSDNNTQKKA